MAGVPIAFSEVLNVSIKGPGINLLLV